MDCFESTVAIREQEKITGGQIPIIAMTAHAMKGDRERCLQIGMDAYVAKPIRAQELLTTIDRTLSGETASKVGVGGERRDDVIDWVGAIEHLEGDVELLAGPAKLTVKAVGKGFVCPDALVLTRIPGWAPESGSRT